MVELQSSDVWLMRAIIWSRTGALEDILHAGDAINHAVFTLDEIGQGLSRLIQGGWIKEENGRFRPTEQNKNAKLVENSSLSKKSQKEFEATFGTISKTLSGKDDSALTPEQYEAAISRYRQIGFQRVLKKRADYVRRQSES